MDFLFVIPPGIRDDRSPERLGLNYLTAALRASDYRGEILNAPLRNQAIEETVSEVLARAPHLVGLNLSGSGGHLMEATTFIRALRSKGWEGLIVLGGHTASFNYDLLLSNLPIDAVVLGEGEETITELLEKADHRHEWRKVRGIAATDGNGAVFHTDPRPLLADLDRLPFPSRDQLEDVLQVTDELQVSSSRGCYARCSFCSIEAFYRLAAERSPWRFRSPHSVVDEIATLVRSRDSIAIAFVDDNFMGPGKAGRLRAQAFAEELIRRNLRVSYRFSCRANDVDRQVFAILKRSGLTRVFLGIESATHRQLRMYNKATIRETNIRALKILEDLGIEVSFGYIPWDAYVTLEELQENFCFLAEAGLDHIHGYTLGALGNSLQITPGTKLSADPSLQHLLSFEPSLESENSSESRALTYTWDFVDERVSVAHQVLLTWQTVLKTQDEEAEALAHKILMALRQAPDNAVELQVVLEGLTQWRAQAATLGVSLAQRTVDLAGKRDEMFLQWSAQEALLEIEDMTNRVLGRRWVPFIEQALHQIGGVQGGA